MGRNPLALLLSSALLVLSFVAPGGGQDGGKEDGEGKKSHPPIDLAFGKADLPQLGSELQAATGLRCQGEGSDLLILQVGDNVRILPKRELKPEEVEAIRDVVQRHRPVHPGADWTWQGGFPPRTDRGAWQKLYAASASDSERLDVLARFAGLKE